jgi:glycopeptide antibiotics resistance protein
MGEKYMNIDRKIRALAVSTFVFYIVILLWITILKCNLEAAVHGVRIFLEPMSIGERFAYATSHFRWKDGTARAMLLNVFIFIPFGVLAPFLRGRTAPITNTVLAALSTLSIESLQLILAIGYFTYSDLILNTLGAVLGIIIYALFIRRMTDEQKIKALTFFNGLAIVVSIFAIINTVLNIEIYM